MAVLDDIIRALTPTGGQGVSSALEQSLLGQSEAQGQRGDIVARIEDAIRRAGQPTDFPEAQEAEPVRLGKRLGLGAAGALTTLGRGLNPAIQQKDFLGNLQALRERRSEIANRRGERRAESDAAAARGGAQAEAGLAAGELERVDRSTELAETRRLARVADREGQKFKSSLQKELIASRERMATAANASNEKVRLGQLNQKQKTEQDERLSLVKQGILAVKRNLPQELENKSKAQVVRDTLEDIEASGLGEDHKKQAREFVMQFLVPALAPPPGPPDTGDGLAFGAGRAVRGGLESVVGAGTEAGGITFPGGVPSFDPSDAALAAIERFLSGFQENE